MPTGNPLLDWLLQQIPLVIVLVVAIWAVVVKGLVVPGTIYLKTEIRADKAEARCLIAEDRVDAIEARAKENAAAAMALAKAVELLAEQLKHERARGDEMKELAQTAAATAQRATVVADAATRMGALPQEPTR